MPKANKTAKQLVDPVFNANSSVDIAGRAITDVLTPYSFPFELKTNEMGVTDEYWNNHIRHGLATLCGNARLTSEKGKDILDKMSADRSRMLESDPHHIEPDWIDERQEKAEDQCDAFRCLAISLEDAFHSIMAEPFNFKAWNDDRNDFKRKINNTKKEQDAKAMFLAERRERRARANNGETK
tara:strand:- start:9489 stop:10037 length:549 start_codon:yes stop_codon:yes gene_type:complete